MKEEGKKVEKEGKKKKCKGEKGNDIKRGQGWREEDEKWTGRRTKKGAKLD